MKNKYEKFKKDRKTRRCQGDVYHSGGVYGGPVLGSAGYHQCSNNAKSRSKYCGTHSRAAVAARRAKRLNRQLDEARALLKEHG